VNLQRLFARAQLWEKIDTNGDGVLAGDEIDALFAMLPNRDPPTHGDGDQTRGVLAVQTTATPTFDQLIDPDGKMQKGAFVAWFKEEAVLNQPYDPTKQVPPGRLIVHSPPPLPLSLSLSRNSDASLP
jgi:hypothetical protein